MESQSQGLTKLAVTPSVLEINMHLWSCALAFIVGMHWESVCVEREGRQMRVGSLNGKVNV